MTNVTLDDLLSGIPGYGDVTSAMKDAVLANSLMPDSFDIWPGEDGYEPTYDVYFAAMNLLSFLQSKPVITSSSSEGTSVSVTPTDWGSLKAYFSSMSPIAKSIGGSTLSVITIPGESHVERTNMSEDSYDYGDADTDIN